VTALPRDRPVFIAGTGRVATALVQCLASAGFAVGAVAGRNEQRTARLAETCKAKAVPWSRLGEEWGGRGPLFIAVSDDAVATTARLATRAVGGPALLVHTSGFLEADVLREPGESRTRVLAFHPVTSFPPEPSGNPFDETLVTLQGDPDAVDFGDYVARQLGATPLVVSIEQKQAIHAASALLANMTVALAGAFESALHSVSIPEYAVRAIESRLLASVTRNLAAGPTADALTGPIARGDIQTVRRHIELLASTDGRYAAAYRTLGTIALDIVRTKGDLDEEQLNGLEQALN
jgi:predicted short-subunit dehydrogenase-like oxidoreductase (DUF2520 family)